VIDIALLSEIMPVMALAMTVEIPPRIWSWVYLYDRRVDRLDSWLNRQHGWRLALLLWVLLLPTAAIFALGAWNWFGAGTSDSGPVLLESGTCSLIAMALVAGLAAASRHRRTRPLSWRALAGVILVSSAA